MRPPPSAARKSIYPTCPTIVIPVWTRIVLLVAICCGLYLIIAAPDSNRRNVLAYSYAACMIALNYPLSYYFVSWRGARFMSFAMFIFRYSSGHALSIPISALIEFVWPYTIGRFLDIFGRIFFPFCYPAKTLDEDDAAAAAAAHQRTLARQKFRHQHAQRSPASPSRPRREHFVPRQQQVPTFNFTPIRHSSSRLTEQRPLSFKQKVVRWRVSRLLDDASDRV
jgi:hypothetical protein